MIAVRFKLPAPVGYLAAGILIGPATPGFVADVALANQLAEIGEMLPTFGVGLHLSLNDLLAVRAIALHGAADRGRHRDGPWRGSADGTTVNICR